MLSQIVYDFKAAWQKGVPNLVDFVPVNGPNRRGALDELVQIDLEYRNQRMLPVQVRWYLDAYPELAANQELLLVLAAAEFEWRKRQGENPSVEEFARRFPTVSPALRSRVSGSLDTEQTVPQTFDLASDAPPAIPIFKVPGYEVLNVLGRGGMGVVYKARHLKLKRFVALKMIRLDGRLAPHLFVRFRGEAEAIARLQHPNIVQVHEVGETANGPFLALEYVEGGSLADKLKQGRLSGHEAARIVAALAEAMHVAHSRNVIHRDLKPGNVLIMADGTPKVTDFGLARQTDDDSSLTQEGSIIGTPSYMAPEQALGRSREAGPVTDVYALGAILYECLTGKPPFRGSNSSETLELVRTQPPVPPRSIRASVSIDLETICLKCLAKEPERRYASARGLADDLNRYLRGEPIQARPISRVERVIKWAKRRPAVASLVIALHLVSILALSLILWSWSETAGQRDRAVDAEKKRREQYDIAVKAEKTAAKERDDARKARDAATTARDSEAAQRHQAERAEAAAQQSLYYNHVALAYSEWRVGNMGNAESLLERCPIKLRGWEWHHLRRLSHTPHRILPAAELCSSVAYSGDGKRLAAGSDGLLEIFDADTDKSLRRIKLTDKHFQSVALSNDGKIVVAAVFNRSVYDDPASVQIWNVDSGEQLGEQSMPTPAWSVALSPDDTKVAACLGETWEPEKGRIIVWDRVTGKVLWSEPEKIYRYTQIAFSPDGNWIVAGGSRVTLRDAGSGKVKLALSGGASAVAFSRDGKRFAWGGGNRTANICAVEDGITLATCHTEASVHSLAFTTDGMRLIGLSGGNAIRIWNAATGRELQLVRGHPTRPQAVAIRPHGNEFATGGSDNSLRIWRYDALHAGEWSSPGVFSCGFLPGGRELLTLSGGTFFVPPRGHPMRKNARLAVRDGLTGAELRLFPTKFPAVIGATSRDGRHLALASFDGGLVIADASNGQVLHHLRDKGPSIGKLALADNGDLLAVYSPEDPSVTLWSAKTGTRLWTLQGHLDPYRSPLAIHRDGKWLVAVAANATVNRPVPGFWDTETAKGLGKTMTYLMTAAFSRDGRWLALAGGRSTRSEAAEISLWDLQTIKPWEHDAKPARVLSGHAYTVHGLSFSPDGRRLASLGGDSTLRIWDVATGEIALPLSGVDYHDVTWSPDGNLLALTNRHSGLRVLDGRPEPDAAAPRVP